MIDKNYQTIINIISSVLNKTSLNMDNDIDIKSIYRLSKAHSLLSIVTSGLEPTEYFKSLPENIQNAFLGHKMACIRKSISFDCERGQILQKMDELHISYLPLKGVILNKLYPEPGMREFADNDIWYDKACQKQVIQIFKDRGYEVESVNKCHHDEFMKKPFYNFEMHRTLIDNDRAFRKLYNYYNDSLKTLMILDEGSEYAHHLNDNDFYIYQIVHGYKHFVHSGNGLRFVMDIYRYNQLKGESLDWTYIKNELSKMDLVAFEEMIRNLSIAVFTNVALTDEQDRELNYMLGSGTYGTMENAVHNRMGEASGSRVKFIWRRLYPGWQWCKRYHPFFAYTIIFMPLLIIGRIFEALFVKRDKAFKELELSKKDEKDA